MYEYVLVNRHFKDLNPILFGEEVCKPGYSFGPIAREHTLIHFVSSGRGTLTHDGIDYPVRAGEAFIIRSGEITTYAADKDDPWCYSWIGFDGELCDSYRTLPHVVKYTTDWAREIARIPREQSTLEYQIASVLFLMHAELFSGRYEKKNYVEAVKDYVNAKYTQNISVEDVARQINLDRRYLSRVFKQKTGKSIQEYIILVRLKKAKSFLRHSYSVADTARLCGYDDVCNFSKMFKKQTGISPGQWKNMARDDDEQ